MMKWQKLIECKEYLRRGWLLKFQSRNSRYQRIMVVCEIPYGGSLALMEISGYDAGINTFVNFPADRDVEFFQLTPKWLIQNWNKWVCPDSDVNEARVREPLSPEEI